MKVAVLPVGQVPHEVLDGIARGIERIFPDTTASVIEESLPLPSAALDKKRNQFSSALLLDAVRGYAGKNRMFDRILGVVDVDIYVSGLNYVFGEAYTPGRVGLISLWRLKPEFYGDQTDFALYVLRSLKEAIHELGHSLGLQHCVRSSCVMHFSNSIFDTDKKQTFFCDQCYLQATVAITNVGSTL